MNESEHKRKELLQKEKDEKNFADGMLLSVFSLLLLIFIVIYLVRFYSQANTIERLLLLGIPILLAVFYGLAGRRLLKKALKPEEDELTEHSQ